MTRVAAGTEVGYTVTFLEMTARPRWPYPPQPAGRPATLIAAEDPPPWYFRALYDAVGRDYSWEDIHALPEAVLREMLHDPAVTLWTLHRDGWPHGFYLLDARAEGTVDLAYFGLVPEAVGTGLGTWLLKTAVLAAWDLPGTRKMTVNTCTLDHPRALALYQKVGFEVVRREDRSRVLTRDRDPARIPD
ncbi:GNAT family N-acetyltransferase [Psychromarinibacter sp. C21-152]|uniref:GNAT family N-acetyltransferase n=1 Tax=Psychromarinibacter sediminicola TaxID=3033385 RepID=A0AAE3NR06_9RHOB|nr:GNAT family N-acetyltransferase [Psychromarinibacter sediminicola]MDF0599355.1 GNAT family N-acetyltransferase [Psychromarinibacter sediminicola]